MDQASHLPCAHLALCSPCAPSSGNGRIRSSSWIADSVPAGNPTDHELPVCLSWLDTEALPKILQKTQKRKELTSSQHAIEIIRTHVHILNLYLSAGSWSPLFHGMVRSRWSHKLSWALQLRLNHQLLAHEFDWLHVYKRTSTKHQQKLGKQWKSHKRIKKEHTQFISTDHSNTMLLCILMSYCSLF